MTYGNSTLKVEFFFLIISYYRIEQQVVLAGFRENNPPETLTPEEQKIGQEKFEEKLWGRHEEVKRLKENSRRSLMENSEMQAKK